MTPSDLRQRKVMASKCSVEPCSNDQDAAETRMEEQQGKEKEETEVPCGNSRLAVRLRNKGPGREQQLSPGHIGIQVVTSVSAVEQVPREETQTWEEKQTFSHLSVNQESQSGVSGPCVVAQGLPRSKPRDLSAGHRERQTEEPRGLGPFYFFGGTNGAKIVSNYCESRGWKRIYNKDREDFNLKWCETKSPAQYSNFREGRQLMYQIPNNKVLTTKIGLLSSLQQYEQVSSRVSRAQGLRKLKLEEFIPTTFRMDLKEQREAFFAQQEGVSNNESHVWICKPTGMNQGRGIFLLKSQEDIDAFRLKLQHMDELQTNRKTQYPQPQAHIVQHYIQNPLLLKGKKFDVRSYLLIACTTPYMVFFRHGYVRLTCDLYDPNSKNLSAHLTNQYMQKKNPLYSQLKEDTVWSMESFNTYVNDRFQVAKDLPRDWVLGAFAKRMQHIMTQCFFAVKSKLDCRLGFFDLIGCDFMVDEDFKVWLLEMNCNPALHTNCEVLKEVIPSVVVETLDLTLEIFKKVGSWQKIFPLVSQREFVLLYSSSNSSPELQKTTKEAQKTEPRRCTSVTEGKRVPSAPPDKLVNVSALSKRRSRSMSGHCPTSTSQSHHESGASTFIQRQRNCCQNARHRVELKLSKCTLNVHLKARDDHRDRK